MSEFTEDDNNQNEQQENPFVWEWEGKKYDLFLANGTGGIGMAILEPIKKERVIGMVGARFAWENNAPFLSHLDTETIDKARNNDDWSKRENESIIRKNAELFVELVQNGYSYDVDEFGNKSEIREKTRKEMLAYRKPLQSDLINHWLKKQMHIERWLPPGMNSVDALLSNVEEVFFTVKVGEYDNPRHLMLLEFSAPVDDAISEYQTKTFERGQNQNQDMRFTRNHEMRLSFGKRYLKSVNGAMLGPKGEVAPTGDQLIIMDPNNSQHLTDFGKLFNPEWMTDLADEVAAAFNLGK